MEVTKLDLYDTLNRMGSENEAVVRIDVFARLKLLKMVEISEDGRPRLTPYGQECYGKINWGDGRVPDFE